ncbi:NAD(P)/FAD-dependent oxidoreductase [Methylobacterium sp. MA0201]|nr:FAD-dependent oxidoreductase [Methylobacterium sp. DB0501]
MHPRTVVVGAGQAAVALIARLRALDADRRITLVGDEPVLPYQRPPLSKDYLKGELAADGLSLRPRDWFEAQGVELRLGRSAVAIDREAKTLALDDGAAIGYDHLALCLGSEPRRLPAAAGGSLAGVHVLRRMADATALRPALAGASRVLIVGGGYLGLEVAAAVSGAGRAVTVLEAAPRLLHRVAAAPTSDYFRDLHRRHGVRVLEGLGLVALSGPDRVERAILSDGSELAIDLVLVGIGTAPVVDLAARAGLTVEDGIAVDERCRTSDPSILAAGDCTSFPHAGDRIRLESVQNAIAQGETAAATLCGLESPYRPKPWFWSNQYDVRLQIAGLCKGYDATLVRPGKRPGSQSVWYFRKSSLIAVDAMNDPATYMIGRKLVDAGINPHKSDLANLDFSINSLITC